jgi:opine dehydrogenase
MGEGIGVLGGSNLGYAYAADLARRGREVTLWVRDPGPHAALFESGRLALTGVEGEHELPVRITTDLDEVLRHDVLVSGIPMWGQAELAARLSGRLELRHLLVLTPGNAGALLFEPGDAIVAETAHPLFGARRTGPTAVEIVARAVRLPTGTVPGDRAVEAAARLCEAVAPVFVPAASVLDAALLNPNPIFHTVPCVMNVGYLQGVPSFHLYRDGMSRGVLDSLYAADRERIALREALGYGAPHYPQWTILEPDRAGELGPEQHLFELDTFRNAATSPAYHGPHELSHRFIDEDTANLVLWSELARLVSVPAPVIDGVIVLIGAAAGVDYRSTGRTAASLGLPTSSTDALVAALP